MPLSSVTVRRVPISKFASACVTNPHISQSSTLRPATTLIARSNGISIRSLWWWSRQGGDWSSYLDENFQKRMELQKKILRYKYSKALRRRALWDRDPSHETLRSTFGWRLPVLWMTKGGHINQERPASRSSTPGEGKWPHQQREEDEWDSLKPIENQYAEEFARFKASIDKDPFGAVFGNRLTTSNSPRNTPWTSFSWMFDSPKANEPVIPPANPASSKTPSDGNHREPSHSKHSKTIFSVPNKNSASVAKAEQAPSKEEYEFDPISMRKVLKVKHSDALSATTPLFDPLFAEKGVSIPVKTYKPHKVYGYVAKEPSISQPAKKPDESKLKSVKKGFESSRLRELQSLKAMTIGNSIDTTAEYFGKWTLPEESVHAADVSKAKTTTSQPLDNAPLFSGATYAPKSKDVVADPAPKNDWLIKEGFGERQQTKIISPKREIPQPVSLKAEKPSTRVQPALDRLGFPERTQQSKLLSRESKSADQSSENKAEDIDLLRASDIRASFKPSRETRADIEEAKGDRRQKLEADYTSLPNDNRETPNPSPSTKSSGQNLSESLNNLWQRVRRQPQELVESTMRSMGVFQDSYRDYVRPEKQGPPLTEKLVFKDDALSKTPSIFNKSKNSPIRTVEAITPSKEVLDAERESAARTNAIRALKLESEKQNAMQKLRVGQLANEIRKAYEAQYGAISVDHRQVQPDPKSHNTLVEAQPIIESTIEPLEIADRVVSNEKADLRDQSTLSSSKIVEESEKAVVKDSEETQAVLHHGEAVYDISRIMQEFKDSRRALHQASQELKALQSRRPLTRWNAQISEYLGSTVKATISKVDAALEPSKTLDAKPHSQTSPAESIAMNSTSPVDVSSPIQTKPTVYKILAYDSSTLQITEANTTSSQPTSVSSSDSDPILHPTEVLSRLNNPAKFLPYFQTLQDQGFEIVKGGGDMLVFKKVREGNVKAEAALPVQSRPITTPVLPKSEPIVEKPIVDIAEPQVSAATASSGPKVRRQEEVFSGQGQMWHQEDAVTGSRASASGSSRENAEGRWTRFKRGTKRVFWTGTATAGIFYAIGAIAEAFGAQQPLISEANRTRKGRPGIFSTEDSR